MHYGLLFEVNKYKFDKHWHYDFDVTKCPPWDLSNPQRTTGGIFPPPPRPSELTNKVGAGLDCCSLSVQNQQGKCGCKSMSCGRGAVSRAPRPSELISKVSLDRRMLAILTGSSQMSSCSWVGQRSWNAPRQSSCQQGSTRSAQVAWLGLYFLVAMVVLSRAIWYNKQNCPLSITWLATPLTSLLSCPVLPALAAASDQALPSCSACALLNMSLGSDHRDPRVWTYLCDLPSLHASFFVSPQQHLSEYYRDLLSIETVATLNAGFCDYHLRHCSPSQQLYDVCKEVRGWGVMKGGGRGLGGGCRGQDQQQQTAVMACARR
jgi:hypothetical protein